MVFAAMLFIGPEKASASAGFGLNDTASQAGYETAGKSTTISGRVETVVSAVLGLLALAFFLLTMYGGIVWLTARGKDEKVSSAKDIIEAAVIGLVIVAASFAISRFVLTRLSNSTGVPGCCYYGDPAVGTTMTQAACSEVAGSSFYDGSCDVTE